MKFGFCNLNFQNIMSFQCQNCRRGVGRGNMVSHAKNRLKRLFKPNLQTLKVIRDGLLVRVKLCTSCIKRLKKDGKLDYYVLWKYQAPVVKVKITVPKKVEKKVEMEEVKIVEKKKAKKKIEEEIVVPTLDISSIVGKKS